MPEKEGIETLKELRQLDPVVPIVMCRWVVVAATACPEGDVRHVFPA